MKNLEIEIEKLKANVNFFIVEVDSVRKSLNDLIDELSIGNEIKIVEERIELLKELSTTLTLDSTIEESLEITYLMEEIRKMVFDFDYIIETDTPEIIIPTIDKILAVVLRNQISVETFGIDDPQNRLREGVYSLSTGETVTVQNVSDQAIFDNIDSGIYSIEGEFTYEDVDSLKKIVLNLKNIVIEDEAIPPEVSNFFIEFKNGEFEGGGEITITNNSDEIIETQWELKFDTAFYFGRGKCLGGLFISNNTNTTTLWNDRR